MTVHVANSGAGWPYLRSAAGWPRIRSEPAVPFNLVSHGASLSRKARPFVCLDGRLREAALQEGFRIVP